MAPKSQVLMAFLIIFSILISSTNGRKLLMNSRRRNNFPTVDDSSLYMAALPKGTVPAPGPSKKGHDQKLIARNLAAVHRILRSVPSPGVGH